MGYAKIAGMPVITGLWHHGPLEDGFFSSIVEVVEAFRAAAHERSSDPG